MRRLSAYAIVDDVNAHWSVDILEHLLVDVSTYRHVLRLEILH
ncbi:MAG TPA: hypothetical protein VIH18_28680 [Candidatus Binatia bacterium]